MSNEIQTTIRLDALGADHHDLYVEAEVWAEIDFDWDDYFVADLRVTTQTRGGSPFVPEGTEIDVTELVRWPAEAAALAHFETEFASDLMGAAEARCEGDR